MDDHLLSEFRTPPRAEFAAALRRRLHDDKMMEGARLSGRRMRRFATVAGGIAVIAVLFALPQVRGSAQTFLDLFRVVNFTAVPVNVNRINELSKKGLDIPTLIGEQLEVLTDPGPPRLFGSPAEASAATGLQLKLPTAVPPWLPIIRTEVQGEHAVRVTADTRKLLTVLDALGISDVRPPAGLDGQVVTVRVPPVVRVMYAQGTVEMAFLQGRSPEVALPAALDLAALGEIGLRIAGLAKAEAHTLAQAIDWRSTMIMPVPVGVSSFRQVDLHGHRALLVESTNTTRFADPGAPASNPNANPTIASRAGKQLVWSEGGSVYVLVGSDSQMMVQMADSVR